MAWLYVRNEDLALDVVQESILKGFRQIKTLKKEKYFKTWMTRILINTAKDMMEQQRPVLQLEPVSYTHLYREFGVWTVKLCRTDGDF